MSDKYPIEDIQLRLLMEAAKQSLTEEVIVFVKKSELDNWVATSKLLYPFVAGTATSVRYHSRCWLFFKEFKGHGFNWSTLQPRQAYPGVKTFVCPKLITKALPKLCKIMEICMKYGEEYR